MIDNVLYFKAWMGLWCALKGDSGVCTGIPAMKLWNYGHFAALIVDSMTGLQSVKVSRNYICTFAKPIIMVWLWWCGRSYGHFRNSWIDWDGALQIVAVAKVSLSLLPLLCTEVWRVLNPPRMIKRVCDQHQLKKHFLYFILKKVCLKGTFRLEVRSIASL